jgi:hypothetical protein
MRGTNSGWVSVCFLLVACGGAEPGPAKEPHPAQEERAFMDTPVAEPTSNEPTRADLREQEEERKRRERESKRSDTPRPEFKENMSVDDAIKAVPPGAERLNLDQDALAEPLKDMKVYEPCKARQNDRVAIRVAIWEGKAVGVDVTTTPKNPKLAECINAQIRQLSWKDSVPSLNTIEFGF